VFSDNVWAIDFETVTKMSLWLGDGPKLPLAFLAGWQLHSFCKTLLIF
jgi:hypothetical protein